ncbi:hypothetical protein C0Q70_05498 [Pomacea canaliculata]|uniref:Apple domain-containing protein n=1 Tax=Pomacea canaliculata TaxID=400727 RepID=A0A2T7PLC3_POMCA|nr:hypothetical protein C0Q70_05498 [Pomacea canaliculata]
MQVCKRVILMLSVLSCLAADVAYLRDGAGFRQSSLSNRIFTDGLLWQAGCRSLATCAISCMLDHRCLAFTLSPVTTGGQRRCRAHSSTALSMSVAESGTQTFFLHHKAERVLDTSTDSNVHTSPGTSSTSETTTESTTAATTLHHLHPHHDREDRDSRDHD